MVLRSIPVLVKLLLWCGSLKKSVRKQEHDTKHSIRSIKLASSAPCCMEEKHTYARQENKLNLIHIRCLRRISGLTWKCYRHWCSQQNKIIHRLCNAEPTTPTVAWICTTHGERLHPKDLLYGQLKLGKTPVKGTSIQQTLMLAHGRTQQQKTPLKCMLLTRE